MLHCSHYEDIVVTVLLLQGICGFTYLLCIPPLVAKLMTLSLLNLLYRNRSRLLITVAVFFTFSSSTVSVLKWGTRSG